MALFVGEFDQVIDAKHRLAIPAALREQMDEQDGNEFHLVLGPDRHLWLYPSGFYRRLVNPLHRHAIPSREDLKLRLVFATARVVKPDSQGRIVLPEKCMQRALISDNVTLVGMGNHVELWPTEAWEQHVAEMLPRYGEDLLDAGDRLASSSLDHADN